MGHEEQKHAEHRLDSPARASDKAVSEPITKPQDNALQRRAEQLLAAKSFRLTGDGQLPFELKTEDGKLVASNKPRFAEAVGLASASSNYSPSEELVKFAAKAPLPETVPESVSKQFNDYFKPQETQLGSRDRNSRLPESILKVIYGDKAEHRPAAHEFRVDKALHTLEDDAKKLLKDGSLTKVQYDHMMKDMEHLRDRVRQNHVDANEAAKVYEQMDKLINAPKAAISRENRITLAQNIINHAAHPHEVSQGVYNTCNVSTVEEHLFCR